MTPDQAFAWAKTATVGDEFCGLSDVAPLYGFTADDMDSIKLALRARGLMLTQREGRAPCVLVHPYKKAMVEA